MINIKSPLNIKESDTFLLSRFSSGKIITDYKAMGLNVERFLQMNILVYTNVFQQDTDFIIHPL